MQTMLKPRKPSGEGNGPLGTKNGSIAAAAIAAAVAGLLIVVFLQQYRKNVDKGGVPTGVLVAQQLIERGASADAAGSENLFKVNKVPRDQLKKGAVTDASNLRGKVAVADILPGQQLTSADFKAAGHGLLTKLAADERAITVTLDQEHGLGGNVRAGDHVDVLSGFAVDNGLGRQRQVLQGLLEDVLVLDVPSKPSGTAVNGNTSNQTSQVTLRVTSKSAPRIAFAADNGKLWLTLRPQNGTATDARTSVTLESLLNQKTAGSGQTP